MNTIFRRRNIVVFLLLLAVRLPVCAQPAADARITITRVEENCRLADQLAITIQVCNGGGRVVPQNTPVSFYAGDPRSAGAASFAPGYLLAGAVEPGRCRTFRFMIRVNDARADAFYAVINDDGRSRPWRLPDTRLAESDYNNNLAVVSRFRFRAFVQPRDSVIERGQTVRLSARTANGIAASYNWSPASTLSCARCAGPQFRVARNDSAKRLIVESRDGCRDTAYSTYRVRPQADYSIAGDSIVCAGDGRGRLYFTVCELGGTGLLPDSLPVSVYQGEPAKGKRIGQPYIFRPDPGRQCDTGSFFCEPVFAGPVTAVVHDMQSTAAYRFPSGGRFDEDFLNNNLCTVSYGLPNLQIFPSDTTVIRGSTVPLRIQSDMPGIVSWEWVTRPGAPLDCSDCPAPVATVRDSSELRARVRTAYGCAVEARTALNIFPPDFTASLLETHCYKNDSLLVQFRLCVNNGYDSVPARLPVSFLGRNKAGGSVTQLAPVFFTGSVMPGNCAEYLVVIPKPADSLLLLRVNDAGLLWPGQIPLLRETDAGNNAAAIGVLANTLRLSVPDTVVTRGTELQLVPVVTGDPPKWVNWEPTRFLDCAHCLATTARPPYDVSYRLATATAYGCTDTASVRIRTTAGGRINIPNAFTPNDDGKNDVFYLTGRSELIQVKHFSIYNRNGEAILERRSVPANDPAYGWNGFQHGRPAPAGTYLYFITVQFSDGSEEEYKGTIVLLR